ncbi:MAG: hypothetical protein H0V32_11950 [Nocardioidaceae bacterium]|nr:hypothetical protein [Nocardioidaceae bacterium]
MRRFLSLLLWLAAVVCLLVGTATAALFGPDDRAQTGLLPVSGDAGVAVVEPRVLPVAGLDVQVTAQTGAERPLFLGLGNAVDVDSYADGVAQTRVKQVQLRRSLKQPLRLVAAPVTGSDTLPGPPDEIDWWFAAQQGDGAVQMQVELPTTQAQVVVVALDGEPLGGLEVGASYHQQGAFGTGLGLAGLALGLVLFGWLAWPPSRPGAEPAARSEPIVEGSSPAAEPLDQRQRRVPLVALALVCGLTTAACELPQRVDSQPTKLAASQDEGAEVVERWAAQRAEALRTLDPQPLSAVEQAPTLQIDEGAFEVARRLLDDETAEINQDLRLRSVQSPRLPRYPVWFVAVVEDVAGSVAKVQVHRRGTAAGDWMLVAQADVLSSTELPSMAVDSTGAITPVGPAEATGLQAPPQDVADAYADLLADAAADGGELVTVDSFVQQMRTVETSQSSVEGVALQQSWSAHKVRWAMRTDDGGALMFATFDRSDAYRLKSPKSIRWAAQSEQRAFLDDSTDKRPTLDYLHQVLFYLPPAGAGAARAIGQYGGVVGLADR